MTEIAGRRLLVALLIVHFVLISRQASRLEGPRPAIERIAVAALAPLAHGTVLVQGGVERIGSVWRTRGWLRRENRALRERNRELERELLRRQGLESDLQRLGRAVEYVRSSGREVQVADVVYVDHGSWLRSLVVRVGPGGAKPGQPVVDPRGLVGRVLAVAGGYAKVQLVTDRAAGVGAMVERTGRQGVARGDDENRLSLEYVPLQADVQVGDRIVTAGVDGVYPRGLPLGVVLSVTPGRGLFHRIELAPLVDLGRLDHVYLLDVDTPPDEMIEAEDGQER